MPTDRFCRVYLPPVVYLAQPKHRILANASRTAQDVMNLGWAIYPLTVADDAAQGSYAVLKAFLIFIHGKLFL
jgi:hypothetical protein